MTRAHGNGPLTFARFAYPPNELGYCGPVEGCIEWMEAQKEAGYSMHGVSVDEQDPKKRADIFRQLVG